MRVNKNVPQRERRRMVLDNFKGVDFSSPPLACAPTRSPDAVNFIGDHGINRKRHGWEQVVRTGPADVKCICQVAEDKLIVVTKNKAYPITRDPTYKRWDFDTNAGISVDAKSHVTPVAFHDKMFFVGAGSLYYDYVTGALKEIAEDDYYIPTTTIDIDPVGVEDQRAMLDMPNLLTKQLKNTMIGYKAGAEYKLEEAVEISRSDGLLNAVYAVIKMHIEVEKSDGVYKCDVTNEENSEGVWEVNLKNYQDDTIILLITANINLYEPQLFGKVKLNFLSDTYLTSKNNITVTYNADRGTINPYKGNIGCTFGVDGANDRLFLAGHPDHPNVIFFSEHDNPFYFPDQYTISVGSPNSKIVAMLRLSDTTLAVFKEPSLTDTSLYFIKGRYDTQYDEHGNIKKMLPVFSITADNFKDAPVTPHACLNFNGDSLFLAKNGIYAIEPQQNVAADIRVARNRAAMLDEFIAKASLANVSGIVYGNRCYVSFGDNGVLVADAAYRYMPEGELSYNYEWWYLENVPARTWAIVNGELWFGTEDGRLCRFTDGYTDSIFNRNLAGELGIQNSDTIQGNETVTGGIDLFGRSRLFNGRRVCFETEAKDGDKDIRYKDLYMCNVDKDAYTFQLSYSPYGKTTADFISDIQITYGNDSPIMMRFYQDTPVTASWSTPPLDLGNDAVAKTMHSMTVTAESGTGAKFKFGYETRNGFVERNAEGTGKFDLNNIDFNDFSFENGFQNSFTVKTHARDFNYIRFHILSEEAAPCAVHRIGAEYKYTHKNRGVK